MAESRAYRRLIKAHPKAHWIRLESWASLGVFDSNACYNGREIWVENKEVVPPKTITDDWIVKPKVRPSQVAWQALRQKVGGLTYIAVMVGSKMYVIPGRHIVALRDGMTLGEVKKLNIAIEDLL